MPRDREGLRLGSGVLAGFVLGACLCLMTVYALRSYHVFVFGITWKAAPYLLVIAALIVVGARLLRGSRRPHEQ